MESLVGKDETELTDKVESDRTECNSPLPQLDSLNNDMESGVDADDALRKALQVEGAQADLQKDTIIHVNDKEVVALEEQRDYFAMGEDQEIQCIARCENSMEDKRRRKDRMIPCFSNAPLSCFRRPRYFTCFGNRFRMCSRAGNFTVLLERLIPANPYSSVQPGDAVSENDDELLRPHQPPRRDIWLVMGPYWPFCLVLTTNLIVMIPTIIILILWHTLPYREPLYAFMALTGLTLLALASVSCRNPGLMPHVSEEPEESRLSPPNVRPSRKWIFNDLTSSWRPRGAVYDRDVNAVIENFDHVCPFTGTAIGGNNYNCFYFFVVMINILSCSAVLLGGAALFYLASNDFNLRNKE